MKTILLLLLALPIKTSTIVGDINRAAVRVDSTIGVAAIDLDTGRTVSIRGDEPFPMASVFKFPLAVEVLHQADTGKLRIDRKYTLTVRDFSPGHSPIRDSAKGKPVTLTLGDLIMAAVADSDNTAGDYLLRLVTPASVTARMKSLNAAGIRVDRPEADIIKTLNTAEGVAKYAVDPRDTATPLAAAALLEAVYRNREALSPPAHTFLMQILGPKSKNPVRIGTLLPKGAKVAHKTGTMPGTMNDVALIASPDGKHHIALAIFTKGAKKSTAADLEKAIAEIAKIVYSAFAR